MRQIYPFLPLLALLPLASVSAVEPAAATPPPARVLAEKPTIVLVHGAWAGGWEWKKLGDLLEADGYKVYRPTHTGMGERNHLASPDVDLNTHIQDVVSLIEWEDLHDIILVGHSYGGMVITGVADRLAGRIQQVIYLDAAVPENGQSAYDVFSRGRQMPATDGFVYPGTYNPDNRPPHIVPQSQKTFTTPLVLEHQDVAQKLPTTYILTADDPTAPEKDGFFSSYEKAKARGWVVQVMAADHVPHINQPDTLAQVLETAIAAQRPAKK